MNHIDGDKTNNLFINLEWVTQKENIEHAYKNGLSDNFGVKNQNNKFSEKAIILACEMIEKNKTVKEIAEKTGINRFELYNLINKKVWNHISDNYNFSNYNYGKDADAYTLKVKKVHKVCQLLEENKHTMKEIAYIVDLPYYTIKSIFRRKGYKYISSLYDIDKFDRFTIYK